MKKIHIILLLLIAASIGVLISFLHAASTYETIAGAKLKEGKSVSLIAKLDKTQPIVFDQKNPNYLSFTAVDSLGNSIKVVYHNPKPDNLESSERLVLKGAYIDNHFECKEIMMKCPSKYKDDMKAAEKNIQSTTQASPATENNSAVNKY